MPRFLLLLLVLAAAPAGRAQSLDERVVEGNGTTLRIAVIDVADRARVDLLHAWAREAAAATRAVDGRFPLSTARVRIRERASRDPSPVPWGQTARGGGEVDVMLYVRPDATFDELRGDWTAVHEFSHLFHPYLGDRGRWLAEGLASYQQEVLRARAGLLDADEAWRRLDAGFARGRSAPAGEALDAVGRRRRATMRVYWAGAAFWLEADVALHDRGSSLQAVLAEHAACCLRGTAAVPPGDFMAALDGAAGTGLFVALHARHAAATEFPALASAYARLGLSRDASGALHLSHGDDGARLRASIMSPSSPSSPSGEDSVRGLLPAR